ncbi:MAG TPA: cytochrome c3 family protein [Stellaceae bacterium]|nr:cytochrome c3 family protein [Stellaceae bacterium]
MAIFGPRANLFMNAALLGAAVLLALALLSIWVVPLMGYNDQERYIQPQPIPFSHKHHVSGLGLDCRYCHTKVEISANAGMPSTAICMTCHSQIWTNAAMLAPDRQSLAEDTPIRWTRIYTLPDYVYFDHSIHVAKGVGCTECHGPIGDMPLTRKAETLYMSWCLQCHRNPAPRLRPLDQVFNPHWHRDPKTPSGEKLMAAYHIHPQTLTDCGVCHR